MVSAWFLLTGATGYIGGRLLRALERQSIAVRCLCRNPEVLRGRVAPGTQVVPGDLLHPASLGPAFAGVETAFYLVHAMRSGREFERLESEAARNFARAARAAGVRPHRLSRRAGTRERPLTSHAEPPGDGQHSARERDSGGRVAGVHRDRFGQCFVRADSRAGGAAPGHGDASLGPHGRAADRHRGRHCVPGRGDRQWRRKTA